MKLHILIGIFVFGLNTLFALPLSITSTSSTKGSRPNVVLITISSLRADNVGFMGYQKSTTPNLDQFAKENVVFSRAFSSSGWMMPAHASIFTSLYPKDHKVTHVDHRLAPEHYTLAEILSDNGYGCAGFCCNPRLDTEHGFAQGFQFFDDFSVAMMLSTLSDRASVDVNKSRTNDLINDAAIKWLQKNKKQPFFMFLHYYDPHWDYLPPPPYDKMFDPDYKGKIDGTGIPREPLYSNPPSDKDIAHMIALYDGEIRRTDEDLGDFLRYLRQNKFLENSLIVILGDHGEEFYDHAHTSHQGLYDELVHVPLVVSIPKTKPVKARIDALVSQEDLLPTILDYLAIKIPGQCQGKSLKPLIEGKAQAVHDYLFLEYTAKAIPDCFAVRSLTSKCFWFSKDKPCGFDLVKDPQEQKKIALADYNEEMKTLQKKLDEWMIKSEVNP